MTTATEFKAQPATFGSDLRSFRMKREDFSQREAALILGVALGTYRNWEQGRNEPNNITQEAVFNKLRKAKP